MSRWRNSRVICLTLIVFVISACGIHGHPDIAKECAGNVFGVVFKKDEKYKNCLEQAFVRKHKAECTKLGLKKRDHELCVSDKIRRRLAKWDEIEERARRAEKRIDPFEFLNKPGW